jgi:hypothetical protein
LNEDNKYSAFYDKEISISPNSINSREEPDIFNNSQEDEYSHSSFVLSDKSRPLYISNENFINYFMHIDYNTPLNKESIEHLKNTINIKDDKSIPKNNSSESPINLDITNSEEKNIESQNKSSFLSKKSKKEKEFGIITDSRTGITYNEEDDPVNYRKAKKRIQNRESALRMRKLRENGNCILEEEICHLKEDNIRLINENISLKKEKEFLIEQIKFMQKIIKQSNLEFKLKGEFSDNNTDINSSNSSNNETKKEPVFYYDGSKQKIKGKLFNVFIICTLSLLYIIGECSLNTDKDDKQNNMGINKGHSIHLNSYKEKEDIKNSVWFYLSKIILVIIFLLIIPLFKEIWKLFEAITKRNKKNRYYNHKYC